MENMEYNNEVFDELMRVVYDNILGHEVYDEEEHRDYTCDNEDIPTYEEFCNMRERFFNRDMTAHEALDFLRIIT